ncbi:carboxymuconolactone decarboxylase family protein [Ancylobacter sp. SL191]|uniref:(R)-mandelonitrile lyase n=1 Tax=Ancylobacter sp. SL191 TaxID=2995166 RepID=UPI00226FEE84|nr:carboxymuconolactone decarboxylase family protein [Ancylobacter sp. SL191]WAC29452.1 carboxymuconolactone decarboxylase family protein [Ancylobacter sp. SL191]
MKKTAASLALSALATTAVAAEEVRRARVAPEAVYQVAPGLGHFTDDVLFGEVWVRDSLKPRDRSLVTVTALIATGKTAQIGVHAARALDNGVTPAELGEVITQLAFYSGWPNAISAVIEVKRVYDERGIGPVAPSQAPRIELEAAAEAARKVAVDTAIAPAAPELAELTNRVLFGDLWQRAELTPRDRSLVTMAALIAIGQPEQLPFHANRAMDNGLTRDEAAETVAHLGFYAGWPRAVSAVAVLQRVFDSRTAATAQPAPASDADLKIVRAKNAPSTPGPSAYFTGDVRVSGNFRGDAPARVSGATVNFTAGARTAWHTHPLGQTLFIISGRGRVQKEGGPIEEVVPGDLVWIPPNVRHWHGASADQAMSHLAVAEELDGKVVTWMEKVTDTTGPDE